MILFESLWIVWIILGNIWINGDFSGNVVYFYFVEKIDIYFNLEEDIVRKIFYELLCD